MATKKKSKKGKLPKKYIKKYGISAKAWREYRKGSLSGAAKKSTKKKKAAPKRKVKVTRKTITKSVRTGASTMARKKRKYTKRKKRTRRLGASRKMRLLSPKTFNAITDGFLVGGGAVGSTFALNMTPFVKDQKAWIKALIQAGVGVLGMGIFNNAYAKKLFAGSVAGAAISMIIPFMPDSFKFAGSDARDFTEEELMELQSMGIPVEIEDTMGVPVDIEEEDTMGIPVEIEDTPSAMGCRSKSRYNY